MFSVFLVHYPKLLLMEIKIVGKLYLNYICLLSSLSVCEVSFSLMVSVWSYQKMDATTGKLGSTRCVIRKCPRLHRFTLHLISVAIYLIAFGRIILADSIIPDMSKWIWIILSTVIMVCLWRMWFSHSLNFCESWRI